MGHVDMRDRRGERDRTATGTWSSGSEERDAWCLLLAGVLALGITALSSVIGLPVLLGLCIVGIVLLIQERGRSRPSNLRKGHNLGPEKQPLLALCDSGGLTAVEAALETSLTVDGAGGILSRLAERRHLIVEGRDGALSHALLARHPAGVAGPLEEAEGRTL